MFKRRLFPIFLILLLYVPVLQVSALPGVVPGADSLWLWMMLYGQSHGVTMQFDDVSDDMAISALEDNWDRYQADMVDQGIISNALSVGQFVSAMGANVSYSASSVVLQGARQTNIVMNPLLTNELTRFWRWMNTNVLGASSATSIDWANDFCGGSGVTLGGYEFARLPVTAHSKNTGTTYWIYIYTSDNVEVLAYMQDVGNGNGWIRLISPYPATVVLRESILASTGISYGEEIIRLNAGQMSNGWYYSPNSNNLEVDSSNAPIYSYAPADFAISPSASPSSGGLIAPSVVPGYVGQAGSFPVPADDPNDTISLPPPLAVDYNVPWPATGDIDTMLGEAWNTTLDNDLELIDVNDGIAVPVPTNVPGDVPVGVPADYAVIGLQDIFPFCIPFDIYDMIQALNAPPVAPRFEIPFVIDGLVDYTFVIDLAPFDDLAVLLRDLEFILFCVGLALITRNIIRG